MESSRAALADDPCTRLLHDLRNMLLIVLAHTDLAIEGLPPDHPCLCHLEQIRSATRAAAALIRNLPESGNAWGPPAAALASQARPTHRTHAGRLLSESRFEPHGVCEERPSILLVEDEAPLREACFTFLAGAGFQVLQAGSGEEALRLLESHKSSVDLLIADVSLPHMTGLELAQRIASASPETKVLGISADCGPSAPNDPQAPIRQFLSKPFSFAELHAKVCELLSGKKPGRVVGAL